MDPALPVRIESAITTSGRQNKFTPVFLNSPRLVQDQINRWEMRAKMNEGRIKIPKAGQLDSLANQYKLAFDKIRARGGTVVLLRLPSSDPHLAREKRRFPREQFWDRLIQLTNTPGIHYADYPETAALVCIEGSHLSPDDAVKYTVSLVQTLSKEYGWKFPSNHP